MNKGYINSCTITPNPAEQDPIVFEKVVYYAGEIKAGEKMGVM